MTRFILVLLLALCHVAAFAQEAPAYTSHFSVSYSSALPLSKFHSHDFEEDYPAFAKQGGLLQLSYTYTLQPHVALGATAGWRHNPFDLGRFAREGDKLVQHKESNAWQSLFTLADAHLLFPARDGFFYLKASASAAFSRSASLNIRTPYGNITRTASSGTAFAYGLGCGLHATIRQFGLGLEAGILATKPAFEVQNAQGASTRYKQGMSTVNLGLSGSYAF